MKTYLSNPASANPLPNPEPPVVIMDKCRIVTFGPDLDSAASLWKRNGWLNEKCIEAAHKLTTTMMAAKHDQHQALHKLLSLVGKACGYCIAKGHPNPTDHFGTQCPSMSPEMRTAFKLFRTSMIYPNDFKGSKPCFYCHVCSMGNDKLHPEFMSRGSK
jgi:hypothetical protein